MRYRAGMRRKTKELNHLVPGVLFTTYSGHARLERGQKSCRSNLYVSMSLQLETELQDEFSLFPFPVLFLHRPPLRTCFSCPCVRVERKQKKEEKEIVTCSKNSRPTAHHSGAVWGRPCCYSHILEGP